MKEKNIKQNLPLKNEHSDNNMAILGNKTKKRIQSEDKYRKQLNIDFPSKLVQNIASNVIFPCSIYINNKDNNIISNLKMNKEINKVLENENNINIIKNNSQNFNMNTNLNISHKNIIEENNNLKAENTNLKKIIQLKEEEIKELKTKIYNLSNKTDKKQNFVDFDNIKIVQFISMDHSLIYSIKCLPSDIFAEVEEKLYKQYPDYRETNNAFQIDGRNILRFKTIEENNIPDGHYVQISKIE